MDDLKLNAEIQSPKIKQHFNPQMTIKKLRSRVGLLGNISLKKKNLSLNHFHFRSGYEIRILSFFFLFLFFIYIVVLREQIPREKNRCSPNERYEDLQHSLEEQNFHTLF